MRSTTTLPQIDRLLRGLLCERPLVLPVTGSSMAPAMAPGDQVRLRGPGLLLPGDVVVFRSSGGGPLVVHRLLGVYRWAGEWRLVTQGDASERPDGAEPLRSLVGVADLRVPLAARLRSLGRFFAWCVRRTGSRPT